MYGWGRTKLTAINLVVCFSWNMCGNLVKRVTQISSLGRTILVWIEKNGSPTLDRSHTLV